MANETNNNVVYTSISSLTTRENTASGVAYAAVETHNRAGYKMDLSTLTEDKIKNLPKFSDLTDAQKTAFLGSASVPAIGTKSSNGTDFEVRQITNTDLVPTDGKTIQRNDNKLQLYGANAATPCDIPRYTNSGLTWNNIKSILNMEPNIHEDSGGETVCDPVFLTAGFKCEWDSSTNKYNGNDFTEGYEVMPPLPECPEVAEFVTKNNVNSGDIINLQPVIVVDVHDTIPLFKMDSNGNEVLDERDEPIPELDDYGNPCYMKKKFTITLNGVYPVPANKCTSLTAWRYIRSYHTISDSMTLSAPLES